MQHWVVGKGNINHVIDDQITILCVKLETYRDIHFDSKTHEQFLSHIA